MKEEEPTAGPGGPAGPSLPFSPPPPCKDQINSLITSIHWTCSFTLIVNRQYKLVLEEPSGSTLTGVPGSPLSPGNPLSPGGPSLPGPPGGPGSPLVPSFPEGPDSPCSPGGPGGPGWPRSPMGPVSPEGPWGPTTPGGPGGPILPWKPWRAQNQVQVLFHDPVLGEPLLQGCYLQLLPSGQGVQAVRPFQGVPGKTGSLNGEINANFTKNQNQGLQIKLRSSHHLWATRIMEYILLEVL